MCCPDGLTADNSGTNRLIHKGCLENGVQPMGQITPDAHVPVPYAEAHAAKYCTRCGAVNDPNAAYCSSCGESHFGNRQPGRIGRPAGVAILAILQILSSLVTILIGLSFGAFIGLFVPFLGGVLGLIIAGLGAVTLIIAIALFTGRNWARILNMLLAVIGLINFPIGTVISIAFLIYFTRPGVVAYFRQPRTA